MTIISRFNRRAILSGTIVAPLLIAHRIAHAQEAGGAATPLPPTELDQQMIDLLGESDAIFGVILVDASGAVVFEHNADLPFASASLYKLVLIADGLLRVERGELALDDRIEIKEDHFIAENGQDSYFDYAAVGYKATVEELLYSTGCYSSNTAAQALMSLTSVEELDLLAVQLGLTSTFYRLSVGEVADLFAPAPGAEPSLDQSRSVRFIQSFVGEGIVNVTTPRDVLRVFELLRDDELGTAVTSWRFKQILGARIINDRLPALLPADTGVIHKTGNLPGVLHDAGIIEAPTGSVIAVAMAQAATDLDGTMSIEQRIGLVAYGLGSR
jgi:beta-lactamase class A